MLLVSSRDVYNLPLDIQFGSRCQVPYKVVHSIPVQYEQPVLWHGRPADIKVQVEVDVHKKKISLSAQIHVRPCSPSLRRDLPLVHEQTPLDPLFGPFPTEVFVQNHIARRIEDGPDGRIASLQCPEVDSLACRFRRRRCHLGKIRDSLCGAV